MREKQRDEEGYQFYLEYNQFLSSYLDHMDREERELTEAFYRHCSDHEIDEAFKKIVARTSPQDMSVMLTYMIPAMNPSDRIQFMSKAKASSSRKRSWSREAGESCPRCWGKNDSGQLDDGTTSKRLTPPSAGVISGVASVATGIGHTCVLTTGKGVRCWGLNDSGQLGTGSTTNRSTPLDTDVFTGVQAIAAAGHHTCAPTAAGAPA